MILQDSRITHLVNLIVKKMIDAAYTRTKKILTDNKEKLDKLAHRLLEKEVIFKEDLEEIFGLRPCGETEIATFNTFNGVESEKSASSGNVNPQDNTPVENTPTGSIPV